MRCSLLPTFQWYSSLSVFHARLRRFCFVYAEAGLENDVVWCKHRFYFRLVILIICRCRRRRAMPDYPVFLQCGHDSFSVPRCCSFAFGVLCYSILHNKCCLFGTANVLVCEVNFYFYVEGYVHMQQGYFYACGRPPSSRAYTSCRTDITDVYFKFWRQSNRLVTVILYLGCRSVCESVYYFGEDLRFPIGIFHETNRH